MKKIMPVILIAFFILSQTTAFAQDEAAVKAPEKDQKAVEVKSDKTAEPAAEKKARTLDEIGKYIEFSAMIQSLFVYKNDSDFDDTPKMNDTEGQSVGYLGTFFRPQLRLRPIEQLSIYYEAEIGLNLWSRNDPAQYAGGEDSTFQIAHREIYAEGHFVDDLIGFKVGYQKFYDPSGLFLGHWMGAASIISDPKWAKFTLSVGQLPDQTYEGVTLDSNNFKHDTMVYGLRVDIPAYSWMNTIAFYGLHDSQFEDRTIDLFAPMFSVSADYQLVDFGFDIVLQAGKTANKAAGDETNFAWALQGWADVDYRGFGFQFNQLVLSADDKHTSPGDVNGGFYYSGKSRSRTLILSEDEIRDRGGNLDEVIGTAEGQFYVMRPGLSLTDVAFSYNVKDIFVPTLIMGAGFVLESDNAYRGKMLGIEADIDFEFRYKDLLSCHLIAGLLAPGVGSAAFANDQGDREETNMMYMFETSLQVFF